MSSMIDDKWEYRVESRGGLFRSFDVERHVDELMNRLGRDGWELVTSHRSWLTRRYRLIFKRRLQPRVLNQHVA